MITLTTLREASLVLNAILIESVRATPDTTIQLVGGQTYIVKESLEEVKAATIDFYQQIGLAGLNSIRRLEDGRRKEEE
ncbi:flagellar FlbD family protein [Exiguobacterium sp. s193]|uniref:flagellar FlbD family protein n=1 Tax=Exiguobacterium sp. s193 TaxID=2751207 RepID=UPI001BE632AA|nr:flagellar FlbD family protein [Exiguobacterium sp. s193]